MQTVEARKEYIRQYKIRNRERIREINRESARRRRGTTPSAYIKRQETGQATSIHSVSFKVRPKEYYDIKSEVSLCMDCYRKYLVPLGCLFCKHDI